MAENLIKTAFRGGKDGFINGHYAIWQNGLSQEIDGEVVTEPNLYAKKIGIRNAITLLKTKSLHGNAMYRKFLDHLKMVQLQEEQNEIDYLTQRFNYIKNNNLLNDSFFNPIQRAIQNRDVGSAYTLLTTKIEDLTELQRELKSSHFKSVQQMNEFWNAQFFKYLEKRLNREFKIQGDKLFSDSNKNLTIDKIVEDWIDYVIGNGSGISRDSLDFISDQMKSGLVSLFEKCGIAASVNSNILCLDINAAVNSDIVQKAAQARKKSSAKSKTKKAKIADFAYALARAYAKGLSTELLAISKQGNAKSASFNTGSIAKTIVNELSKESYDVYQKGDLISIEAYQTSLDIGQHADRLFNAYALSAEDKIEAIKDETQRLIGEMDSIFIVETNVKGYLTRNDRTIEGEGSFANRLNNLKKMEDIFPANIMNRLIFLMVNTFDDCIASHRISELSDYIAAAVAAWMWDDYEQIYTIGEPQKVRRIRMFMSGNSYMSASEVLKEGIRILEEGLTKEGKSFVNVSITPPSFNAQSYYDKLVAKHPVKEAIEQGDEDRVQNLLQERWDSMKDKILKEGTMSISLDYEGLENLLGKFEQYVF